MFNKPIIEIPDYRQNGNVYLCDFSAFNCNWQIQIECRDERKLREIIHCIYSEVLRLEDKYTLQNYNNIMALINRGTAESLIVDDETAALLDFSDACCTLSQGKFDISYYQLQNTEHHISSAYQMSASLKSEKTLNSGWHKIRWDNPRLRLLQGMKLNFDSFICAHAADKALALAEELTEASILINYSGNIIFNRARKQSDDWWVSDPFDDNQLLPLQQSAMAFKTNKNMNIYDAVLNKQVFDAAKLIMVQCESATEANMLATLARLEGKNAEQFLIKQQANYKILF